MTERKDIKIRRKPRPNQHEGDKESANTGKKKRWKKRYKKPKKNLGESLQELQAVINGKYHAP